MKVLGLHAQSQAQFERCSGKGNQVQVEEVVMSSTLATKDAFGK